MYNKLLVIKELLAEIAEEHKPEGTEVKAIIDQWVHAIATESQFFCDIRIISASKLKEYVISRLKQDNLFIDVSSFYDLVFKELKLKPEKNSVFKFIDLFAGIGGVRLGFQQSGGACVFSSEFDKHAQTTYAINHGEIPFGDITKIDPKMVPDHDILLGGFPCQAFSIAGHRQGFNDEKGRGNLFFNVLEVIKEKKPKAFLLENVKNLKGHDEGNTFETIKKLLEGEGYSVIEKILNSMDYANVPQTRERIYIIGFKGEAKWETMNESSTEQFKWPEKQKRTVSIQDILEKKVDEMFYYEKYACHDVLKEEMTKKRYCLSMA
jgi:DNA (cytosine-5)-methyltransferase 1